MTHLALPEQWTFRGQDFSTWATMVTRVDGTERIPALRGDLAVAPGRQGRMFGARVRESHRIGLAIFTSPMNAAGGRDEATDPEQARVNLDALFVLLGDEAEGPLCHIMPDGSVRTAQAVCASADLIGGDGYGQDAFGILADFELANPIFLGDTEVTAGTGAMGSSPATFSITNPGSATCRNAVITCTGPLGADLVIANRTIDSTGGHYVAVSAGLATGAVLTIDCGTFTAIDDSAANWGGFITHRGAREFLHLRPGANSIRVTSSDLGEVAIAFFPPYLP